MKTLAVNVPSMYADHHVTEVRRILLALPGVSEVYASSAFHAIEIAYDPKKTAEEAIKAALEPTGYLNELPAPAEPGVAMTEEGGRRFARHTASYPQTGQAVSFVQKVVHRGQSGWACPGMGTLNIDGEE